MEGKTMHKVKIILCIVMIFSVAISSGCGRAVVQVVGKGVAKTISKAPRFVKGEFKGMVAEQVFETAYDKATDNKPQNSTAKPSAGAKVGAIAGGAIIADELLSEDKNWIKDLNNGAYIWNPEQHEGESVRWSGNVIREGNNLYAQGPGKLEWYMDGKLFETEEGNFERGKQHGRFVHINSSGEKFYSNWDNGEPISVERPTIQGALNAKDLSLGELSIDDRAEKVASKMGKADSSSTDSDGGQRLKFKDAEVVIKNGKISALVSFSPVLKTPRGIHEGSSVQEVLEKYGTGCMKTSFGDQTLYEYAVTSADGTPCLLRFAINNSNGKVDYISERFAQSEPAKESQSNEAPAATVIDTDTSAEQAFINYHKAVTAKNYREAYETLSYKQRERRGDFDTFVKGFADTISSEVTDLKLVSSDDDSRTFNYTLTARDRAQGNRVKVMTFKGQVVMAKDKGRWYIRSAQSDKVNERYE